MPLDFKGQNHFLDFAVKAAVRAIQKEPARQLHRQSACSFGAAAPDDIPVGSLGNTRQVDAEVLLEVLILGADNRVPQYRWNLIVGEQDAALKSKRADRLAVVGI